MSESARKKLEPSHQLSDQREALGYDVDLTDLTLALRSRASLSIIEMITGGEINRTIEGASTLTITLRDRDRTVRKSGILTQNTSVKIDGLWFRLIQVSDQGDDVNLSFEDREVNVLRQWPPRNDRKTWGRMNAAASLGPPGVARARFAQRLVIDDVKGELAIRFVSPILKFFPPIHTSRDRPKPEEKRQRKDPGLPKGAKIMVANGPATELQRINLERVLDVGWSMREPEDILVLAVMAVTQESRAENIIGRPGTCSNNGQARGILQHCIGGGRPDGQGNWPTGMDIEEDARSFYEVAEYVTDRIASGALPPLSPGATVSEIQRDESWHTDHQGREFQQWFVEASRTVRLYLGTEVEPAPPPSSGGDPPPSKAPLILAGGDDTAGMFYRGKRTTRNGRKTWDREDNWDCLQRLAAEVQWRCFVVSGTVYFLTEPELFHSAPAITLTPGAPGVDSIDGTYDIGAHNASVTVQCRAALWDAPPGSPVEIDETGLYDGRWIVASIRRGLFNPAATVILKKPRPVLPESKAPEYGKGQQSGIAQPKKKPGPPPPPPPGGQEEDRLRIVKAAHTALAVEAQWHYHYLQQRPFPSNLFSAEAHSPGIDCSAFVILVYKAAGGVDDPSGNGFDGSGNTCDLWNHGRRVQTPKPGDLVLYGEPCGAASDGHVGVVVEAGQVIEIGGEAGVSKLPIGYRTVAGYVSIFPEGQ